MLPEAGQEVVQWRTDSLRFTGFPVPSANILQATWWQDLIGQPPETEILQAKVGVKHIEGTVGIGKLILELSPQRIDWVFTSDNQNSPLPTQNSLGESTSVMAEFSSILNQWLQLQSVPNFRRIALGGVLTISAKSKQDGYRGISRFLPNVQIDSENSSDFLYQINRPRPSRVGIPNLNINRLTKWSVMFGFLIPINPGVLRVEPGLQDFACRLEFDINTSADFSEEISREQAGTILSELVDLSVEISQQGDIP